MTETVRAEACEAAKLLRHPIALELALTFGHTLSVVLKQAHRANDGGFRISIAIPGTFVLGKPEDPRTKSASTAIHPGLTAPLPRNSSRRVSEMHYGMDVAMASGTACEPGQQFLRTTL